jgi:hypothetical protein
MHWMHIHGGTGNCPEASAARLNYGHRFVSAKDADPVYGHVVASLTTSGDTAPPSHLDRTRYPTTGDISYTRTFPLGPGVASEIRSGYAVIVVHGIDYNGNGVYDNSIGPDGERSAPALCGRLNRARVALLPAQTAATGSHGSPGTTYTASLRVLGASSAERSPSPLSLCHIASVPVTPPPTAAEARARRPI